MIKEATLSRDGCYRYSLTRDWFKTEGVPDEGWPGIDLMYPVQRVCFIMLNPSTADANKDDPTIRRCIDYARRWGFGGLEVVNLFAYRATDPHDLKDAHEWGGMDIRGEENIGHIKAAVQASPLTVCAWGNHGDYLDAGAQMFRLLGTLGVPPFVLGMTKVGQPVHPLYQRKAVMPYRPIV